MLHNMLLLPLVSLLLGASPALVSSSPSYRAYGGVSVVNPNYTDIANYPFTVAVLKGVSLLGGGVIIKRQWVLTAAYNTDGLNPSDLKVRIGSNDPTTGGRLYRVTEIIQHPQYSGDWTYDLALLRLGAGVNLNSGRPVNAVSSQPVSQETPGTVTGYGVSSSHGMGKVLVSPGLQVAAIAVYDYSACNHEWYGKELTEGQVCGYTPGSGPCYADFGDPLTVCGGDQSSCVLVGIFAGSYGCADDHFPAIYVDVGYFYSWIQQNSR